MGGTKVPKTAFVFHESLYSTLGTGSTTSSGLHAGDTRANETDLIPDLMGFKD